MRKKDEEAKEVKESIEPKICGFLSIHMKVLISELNGKLELAFEVNEEARVRLHKATRDLNRVMDLCRKELGVPRNYVLLDLDQGFVPEQGRIKNA